MRNNKAGSIVLFCIFRCYIRRGGRHIMTTRYSLTARGEHLMAVFYDIMLLDVLRLIEPR